MITIPYSLIPSSALPPALGLIVLQADETLEPEFKQSFAEVPSAIYVSRIPSATQVTPETLSAMQSEISASANLLPKSLAYEVVGYGCTSASAIIGSDAIETLVQRTCNTITVTNPLRAATAYAADQGISKLALLSPYTEDVNMPLRSKFEKEGLSTDVFGSFCEPEEAKVARITSDSIVEAAVHLGKDPQVEAVFISCTNLKTAAAIPQISAHIGKPAFSSNSALSWHMKYCAKMLNNKQLSS